MNRFSPRQRWSPELHWNTPAGGVIDRLIDALPSHRTWRLIIFGSAPLQLGLDPHFLSADIDVISQDDITDFLRSAGLLKGQASIYVEPCPANTFTAAVDWQERAHTEVRRHAVLIFPHPIDILVSKVKRLEEKDLDAFRLVLQKTGHPTEDELKEALRRVVDIYRPNFDEETGTDSLTNTKILWRQIYGKGIDVRREIIARALADRRKAYHLEKTGIKRMLKEVAGRYPAKRKKRTSKRRR